MILVQSVKREPYFIFWDKIENCFLLRRELELFERTQLLRQEQYLFCHSIFEEKQWNVWRGEQEDQNDFSILARLFQNKKSRRPSVLLPELFFLFIIKVDLFVLLHAYLMSHIYASTILLFILASTGCFEHSLSKHHKQILEQGPFSSQDPLVKHYKQILEKVPFSSQDPLSEHHKQIHSQDGTSASQTQYCCEFFSITIIIANIT